MMHVYLERESCSLHDHNSIRVELKSGDVFGHLESKIAAVLAPLTLEKWTELWSGNLHISCIWLCTWQGIFQCSHSGSYTASYQLVFTLTFL